MSGRVHPLNRTGEDMLQQVIAAAPPAKVTAHSLRRILWGHRLFGSATLGASLVYAYWQGDDWLTTKEIAELAEISEDTARRMLAPLCDLGRVKCRVEGRKRLYRLDDELARKSLTRLITFPV